MCLPHPEFLMILVEREVMWLKKSIGSYEARKFAIFAAGEYGKRFYHWLKNEYGKEADFFIDNDPALNNQFACGKPILLRPWEAKSDFGQDYFVIVSTCSAYYQEIIQDLNKADIPYISSDAFRILYYWERSKAIINRLVDDCSKVSYLSVLWYWLTYDNSFVQSVDPQYFSVKGFMHPLGERIVDLGAFTGDTVEEYLKRALGNCTIYAFEPNDKLYMALETRTKRLISEWALSDHDIIIVPAGVGRKSGSISFKKVGTLSSHILMEEGAGEEIKIYSLDDYFADKPVPTLIKADIEGAELDMLQGAKNLIQNNKPKLAISLYHNPEDFICIPEYLYSLNEQYRMAVRNHSDIYVDTILYCF